MGNRFERLFQLPQNQYIEGAPVILAAGVLSKDTNTGSIVAQLKFQSVSEKHIKAAKVTLAAYDVSNAVIEGVNDYQYLELDISNGQEFGANKAIFMPNPVSRSFSVSAITVVFSDGTMWNSTASFTVLSAAEALLSFGNSEMEKQYRLATNDSARYVPVEGYGLWQCACGLWNHGNTCARCRISKEKVFSAFNIDVLTEQMNLRLAAEAEQKRIHEEQEAEKKAKQEAAKRAAAKKIKLIAAIAAPVIAVLLLFTQWVFPDIIQPAVAYSKAEALLEAGNYDSAAAAFEGLGEYEDAADQAMAAKYCKAEMLLEAGDYDSAAAAFEGLGEYEDAADQAMTAKYCKAEALLEAGDEGAAAVAFGRLGDYQDAGQRAAECWNIAAVRDTVSAGVDHTVGLKADGTVVATKYIEDEYFRYSGQCDVSGWKDIVAVAAGLFHTVGLKADGTVVARGGNYDGQCDVNGWEDIVAVAAGDSYTVGLKADGTVVATGENDDGQCNVSGWKDIVAVAAGDSHTVGLKADGTVVATGENDDGQCDVSGWEDIVAVAAGLWHTVGLKADGAVVATRRSIFGACDVSDWKNIVAVAAGRCHTVGLKADGTVVATKYTGVSYNGQCAVSSWRDIKRPK